MVFLMWRIKDIDLLGSVCKNIGAVPEGTIAVDSNRIRRLHVCMWQVKHVMR